MFVWKILTQGKKLHCQGFFWKKRFWIIPASVVHPDPDGSEIICKLGSGSVINSGSGSDSGSGFESGSKLSSASN